MDTNYKRQIWVAAFCAAIADRDASIASAMAFADVAVQRCKERFPKPEEVNPWETGVIDKNVSAKGVADEADADALLKKIEATQQAFAKANASVLQGLTREQAGR